MSVEAVCIVIICHVYTVPEIKNIFSRVIALYSITMKHTDMNCSCPSLSLNCPKFHKLIYL